VDDRALRRHVSRLLDWGDAHASFDAAVTGIPPSRRGVVPPELPHSAWQLVEHMRLAQADILEFCVARRYKEKPWPAGYWPRSAAPPNAAAWNAAIAGFRRDRRAVQRLARDRRIDLMAIVPNGTDQTYLREILLIADHTAYHVGQLVLVRRALGIWS
jgi:uncharacterized damage-inducible protein DinB